MKQLSLAILLISVCNGLSGMDGAITLPSQNVLQERLLNITECNHFIQNSQIIEKFAGKNQYPAVVFMVVGFEIDEYNTRFKKPQLTFAAHMLKPRIVECILQDHPQALALLKKENIMTDPVQLPTEQILRQRFIDNAYDHLATKSTLIKQLANQRRYPTEHFMIIATEIDLYCKKLNHTMMARAFKLLQPLITAMILQDYPDAIRFLVNENLLNFE